MTLTKRQAQVLKIIAAFRRGHGYSPTYQEIASGLGLRSASTAHGLVRILIDKGYLRHKSDRWRSLELRVSRRRKSV